MGRTATVGFYATKHMLFTQHYVAIGLCILAVEGETADMKELIQLNMHDVLEPQRPEELTSSERATTLAYLMFLKEIRTGKTNGRMCADWGKQREYMYKESEQCTNSLN